MATLTRTEKNLVLILTFAIGALAANIYYAQPILNLIAKSLNLRPDAAGLIMTLTQIGYGVGVLFVVPLGDLVENKKLILGMIAVCIVGEIGLYFAQTIEPFFVASLLAGLGASTVQILVPYTTHLFDKALRGQIIGTLMSGLMIGIMLSRPISSLVSEYGSYHMIFLFSAVILVLLLVILSKKLPAREPPKTGLRYHQLILSMLTLLKTVPTLRRRAFYQACLFGAFCLFWTIVPLFLMQSAYQFTQKGVALFALAGLAGAAVAPLAGRLADKGLGRRAMLIGMGSVLVAFLSNLLIEPGSTWGLILLVLTANLLDAGVSAHLVLGQRAIFMIDPANQSRLNGLYLVIVYMGGSIGSALATYAFTHGSWIWANAIGAVFPVLALLAVASERVFSYREAS